MTPVRVFVDGYGHEMLVCSAHMAEIDRLANMRPKHFLLAEPTDPEADGVVVGRTHWLGRIEHEIDRRGPDAAASWAQGVMKRVESQHPERPAGRGNGGDWDVAYLLLHYLEHGKLP